MKLQHAVLCALSAIASTLVWAGPAAAAAHPATVNANFRRVEAVKAAGAKPGAVRVVGVGAKATEDTLATAIPKNLRVQAVAVTHGASAGKVTLIKVPVDKTKPVTKLTVAEAKEMNVLTQAEAHRFALYNTGKINNDKLVMNPAGLTRDGKSYNFKEPMPAVMKADYERPVPIAANRDPNAMTWRTNGPRTPGGFEQDRIDARTLAALRRQGTRMK